MNELTNQKNDVALAPATSSQVGFNFFDPIQFDTMQRVCRLFASSELVPDMYQAKYKPIPAGADENTAKQIYLENRQAENKAIANCMIAVEISQRIGASPLMIMQNMTPIYGKPSWSSKFLVATVNTCGRFNPLQFRFTDKGELGNVEYVEYIWNQQTRSKQPCTKVFNGKNIHDFECVAYTTAKGSDNVLESSPVSIRLAIQEGWYTKNGSKWQTMAKQMLMYRAASFWTSVYAPELSMGMRTVEENQDIIDVTDYQSVDDVVKAEIRDNANKVQLGDGLVADDEEKGTQAQTDAVDAETGEIKKQAEQEPEKSSLLPGF